MKRDVHQRQAYAYQRMSKAVDRTMLATTPAEKDKAAQWAKLWKAATLTKAHVIEQAKARGLVAIEQYRAAEREEARELRELERQKATQQQAKTPAQKRNHSHGMSR